MKLEYKSPIDLNIVPEKIDQETLSNYKLMLIGYIKKKFTVRDPLYQGADFGIFWESLPEENKEYVYKLWKGKEYFNYFWFNCNDYSDDYIQFKSVIKEVRSLNSDLLTSVVYSLFQYSKPKFFKDILKANLKLNGTI
jgi:hypothetical protein